MRMVRRRRRRISDQQMTKTFALALGGGGARGLAHILVVEALEEMGVQPVAIAGTSFGAVVGAAYAAGMSAREMRRHVLAHVHDRPALLRGALAARATRLSDLWSGGLGHATLLDAEKLCARFMPAAIPNDFARLNIPLTVVASDLYARRDRLFTQGPLYPALAASIAIPGLIRPIGMEGRVLVDGNATNPVPFDLLRQRADVVVAVDVSGAPSDEAREVPGAWESFYATMLAMAYAITAEKLRAAPPDLVIRPNVAGIRTMDFFRASSILRTVEPVKQELKDKLGALLA